MKNASDVAAPSRISSRAIALGSSIVVVTVPSALVTVSAEATAMP